MTVAHWIYLIGTIVVIATMLCRRNVVVPSIIATLVLGAVYKGSLTFGIETVFNAGIYSANQLFSIFLIIAIMMAMLKALSESKADQLMVKPIQKLMISPLVAFIVLVIARFLFSLFFWPTPVLPLVGALLIPPAIVMGLSPMTSAMAVAIAGQVALASDYIIQGGPTITAKAAKIPVELITNKGTILAIIIGVISLTLTYIMQRKEDKAFRAQPLEQRLKFADLFGNDKNKGTAHPEVAATSETALSPSNPASKWLAILVPLAFLVAIVTMLLQHLKGNPAVALIGGTSFLLLLVASFGYKKSTALEDVSHYLIEGFIFTFKKMGPVIPIGGFFFLGSPDGAEAIMGKGAPGFLFDMATNLGHVLPPGSAIATFGLLILGLICGIDGSGFAGLPLVGVTAGALGAGHPETVAMMGAVGQMGSVLSGGGALVPWSSLIAVAGIAGVNSFDLAKKNFIPIMAGLIVATIFALIVW